jgi:hypothetical protein
MQVPELYEYLSLIDQEHTVCRVQPLYVISWKLTNAQKQDIYKYWFDSINNLTSGAKYSTRILEQFLAKPDPVTGQIVTVSQSPPRFIAGQ